MGTPTHAATIPIAAKANATFAKGVQSGPLAALLNLLSNK